MLTLDQHLEAKLPGFAVVPFVPCPCCKNRVEPFALVRDQMRWRCGYCLIDEVRAAEPDHYELTWDDVRGARAVLLARCDWTQLPDVPEATRALWAPYRQALRDITSGEGETPASEVVWPTPPEN